MAHERNHNGAAFAGPIGRVDGRSEMEAFDRLGPKAKAQLNYGPVEILALPVLAQVDERGLDPRESRLDELLARALLDESAKVLAADRAPEDVRLGLQPIERVHGPARHRLRRHRRR